jgi:hypothetical protein
MRRQTGQMRLRFDDDKREVGIVSPGLTESDDTQNCAELGEMIADLLAGVLISRPEHVLAAAVVATVEAGTGIAITPSIEKAQSRFYQASRGLLEAYAAVDMLRLHPIPEDFSDPSNN